LTSILNTLPVGAIGTSCHNPFRRYIVPPFHFNLPSATVDWFAKGMNNAGIVRFFEAKVSE